MHRKVLSYAAGSILTALLAGCTLTSPDQLPTTTLKGDTTFTLLQTTDIHDHAQGDGPMSATATTATPGPLGSYARIAAYVNGVRAAQTASGVPVVLVDSGDWTMGTVYDLTGSQQPLSTFFLDTLRYDCATLGNHEFDYTPKGLASILATSRSKFGFHTPLVISNMVLSTNTDLVPYVGTAITTTYTETLPNGLKVGFLGLMGTDAAASAPASFPVTFTDYSKNYASIQTLVDGLRNTQGCNVVIALNHAGTNPATGGYTGEDISLAQNVTGIDVIASGHTHNPFGGDGNADHPVKNGAWTTQVICAGAYSTNVSRLDLTYHFAAKNTTVTAASNLSMNGTAVTDFDPAQSVFVGQADAGLNFSLGTLFTTAPFNQIFPTYTAADLSSGLYRPVGITAQDMKPNDINPVLSPNGLGNLCADADRSVPNGILNQVVTALLAAHWTGSPSDPNLPAIMAAAGLTGYDLTPYTGSVVPTGVVRDDLLAGAPISFANLYQVLPLGISPDSTQALPVGYPMMSAYLTLADLKTLCGLQLVGQTNLVGSSYYLNLSGFSYDFDTTTVTPFGISPFALYFKEATAAAVLQVTSQKAAGGSTLAGAALVDLGMLATDSGASLKKDAPGNPYAAAMINLDDAQNIAVNIPVLGMVAQAAQTSTKALNTMIVSAAGAAINNVYPFTLTDPTCTTAPLPASALTGATRYRLAADLYGILMMGALNDQYGVTISPYPDATSDVPLSAGDMATLMKYRINATPGPTLVELKEWEALLLFLTTPQTAGGLGGAIPAAYASTPLFTDTPGDGAAVTVRNATYPLPNIGALITVVQTLTAAN